MCKRLFRVVRVERGDFGSITAHTYNEWPRPVWQTTRLLLSHQPESQLSGCYAQHDLAVFMRRTSKRLVGNPSFFQGEHSPQFRNSVPLSNSSEILFSRAVVTST